MVEMQYRTEENPPRRPARSVTKFEEMQTDHLFERCNSRQSQR